MKKLSLEGLQFSATEINIKNNIMEITLNRPEKKNALNSVMTVSYTHLTLPTNTPV